MIYPLKNWQKIKRGYLFGEKTFYSPHHLGIDYIVPEGTPIYAPINCEIIVSGNFPEGGNTLHACISDTEYGKLIMRCMHLNQPSQKGVYKEGDVLGYTGNTGKLSKGPHLHLDISKNAVKLKEFINFIDPEKFFSERISNLSKKII